MPTTDHCILLGSSVWLDLTLYLQSLMSGITCERSRLRWASTMEVSATVWHNPTLAADPADSAATPQLIVNVLGSLIYSFSIKSILNTN